MSTLGVIGCILGFLIVIYLCYKDWSVYLATFAGACVVIACNTLPFIDSLVGDYVSGMFTAVKSFFFMILFGCLQSKIYTESGAAYTIADTVMNRLLKENMSNTGKNLIGMSVILVIGTILNLGGIIAGVVIAVLGGASYQISGPTGAMSAVLIGIVAQYGLQGVFFACFAAGVLLLAAGLLKLGRLIGFIPMPVIMGFTSGIAIIIALGQVDNFFGTVSEGSSNLEKLASYARLGFHPNLQAVLIGVLVVAVMLVWPKKWGAKIPGSLIGIIAATALAAVLGLDELAVVGDIPRTLLLSDRLHLGSLSLDMLSDLISPVVTIAALGMIESLLCGASAARMKSEPFHADQELIAQGVGNILLPFFGGVPATAAIARTSVAIKSGQQTRLTSVFHSVFLLASMFLLGGVMARLPLSALAGVLMVTAWRMNDWAGIRYIFTHRFKSAISQFLVTMLATVVFDLTVAIILGVIYSAILYVARSSRIHVAFSTIDGNRLRYDVGKSPILDSAGVVYVTGSLFFGAVDEFNHRLQDIPEEDHLILSLRGMPSVDVSGAQAVLELCHRLLAKGHTIAFCGVAEDVRSYFDRAGVTALVGESAYYHSADRAILALLDEELLEA